MLFEVGDRDALRSELAEKPIQMERYARMRFNLGEFEAAAESFAAVYEERKTNYNLMHAALTNLHLNRLDTAIQQLEELKTAIIEDGPNAHVYRSNQPLAGLMMRALSEEWRGEQFLAESRNAAC